MNTVRASHQWLLTSWGRLYTRQDPVLVANIACILCFREVGAGSWRGAMRPLRLYHPLALGERYRLRLRSGWMGDILITRAGARGGRPYLFQGEGPLEETGA